MAVRLTSDRGFANRACAVIIPAYNAARFVGATLDSVRAQTVRPIEILVVDDGSQDETGRIAEGFPEARLIRQKNAGVAAARNRGVRETHSEWLAFLDADDLWMPEKLRRQFELAESLEVAAVFCDLHTIDVAGAVMRRPPAPPVSLDMEPLLMHSETIPQATSSTLLVRRSIFESVGGYDESLATMADWDLLIRLRSVTTFAYVPEKLVAYRRYPGTMSRSVPMLERESSLILNKVFARNDLPESWRQLKTKSWAWNDLVLAGSYFEAGRAGKAIRFGLRAVKQNPRLLARVLTMPLRRARRLRSAAQ